MNIARLWIRTNMVWFELANVTVIIPSTYTSFAFYQLCNLQKILCGHNCDVLSKKRLLLLCRCPSFQNISFQPKTFD